MAFKQPSVSDSNVVILWDVENVLPSSDSFFVEGLMEHAAKFGRVLISKAYADWRSNIVKKLIPQLSDNHFELIHVHNPNKLKNSSDILMITHGMEIAMQYPNVNHFMLVTGDSDFRPLVSSLRRSGRFVHIICDNKRVTDSLLTLADDFIDYRQIIPGGTDDEDTEIETVSEPIKSTEPSRSKSKDSVQELRKKNFALLAETVRKMEENDTDTNIANVKVRLKLLNPVFDEQSLGFSQWSKFVEKAEDQGYITLEGSIKGSQAKLRSVSKPRDSSILDAEADAILKVLKSMDESGAPRFHLFSKVAKQMKVNGVDYKSFGYNQFKKYVASLEARDLVITEVNGLKHFVKRDTS